MLNWTDKQNGVDDVLAEDINNIAHAVIDLQSDKNNTIDQTYSPTSENAQSGKAVAEAIASIGGGSSEKEWELLDDITLTESVSAINLPIDKINAKNEVHIEGYIVPTDTTITSQVFQFNDGRVLWQTNVNCKATGNIYVVMDIYKSPRGKPIFDGTVSAYAYTLSGANFKTTQIDSDLSVINSDNLINSNQFLMRTTAANPMTIGTRVKVWGR